MEIILRNGVLHESNDERVSMMTRTFLNYTDLSDKLDGSLPEELIGRMFAEYTKDVLVFSLLLGEELYQSLGELGGDYQSKISADDFIELLNNASAVIVRVELALPTIKAIVQVWKQEHDHENH